MHHGRKRDIMHILTVEDNVNLTGLVVSGCHCLYDYVSVVYKYVF